MAMISVQNQVDPVRIGESSETDKFAACSIRARSWAAVDSGVEARFEAQLRRKTGWREALLGWLIEFNRY